MNTTLPISKHDIKLIITSATFDELDTNSSSTDQPFNEIENDLHCLLDWLDPYYPQDPSQTVVTEPSPRVRAAIRSCLKDDVSQMEFVKLYINSIRKCFNDNFKPFINSKNDHLVQDLMGIMNRIKLIKVYYSQYITFLNLRKLSNDLFNRNLNSLFHIHVIKNKNSPFQSLLTNYLIESLFNNTSKSSNYAISTLQDYIKTLISIGFIDLLNSIVIKLSIKKIKHLVINTCRGVWDVPLLEKINDLIKIDLYPSFNIIMRLSSTEFNQSYLFKLMKISHDELVSLRINELYQMIVNYPSSSIALSELHQCILFKSNNNNNNDNNQKKQSDFSNPDFTNHSGLSMTSTQFSSLMENDLSSQAYQRAKLVDTFIQACHENLLHSGANTVDVITTYTSTIKAFLIIDPKGVLLDKVVRPIRRYLKTREDIIIKLVHGLLNDDDESNELAELAHELRKPKNHNNETDMSISGHLGNSTNDKKNVSDPRNNDVLVDDLLDLNWVPDPIDALPDFKKGKVTDVIESLISIFDLKDVFINEFTKLFGDRLINIHDYDLKDIIYHLDLLKSRFGKNEFTTLDVMVRDVHESKNINKNIDNIAKPHQYSTNFHSTVLSHLYWPHLCEDLSEENDFFKLPDVINDHFCKFNEGFTALYPGRYLKPLSSIGLVKLELDFNNQKLAFEVTPDKAVVISLFDDEAEELSLDQILTITKMPLYVASKAIEYWVNSKILIQTSENTFKTNETLNTYSEASGVQPNPSELLNNKTETGSKSKKIDLSFKNLLWRYVNGILSNISPLPATRIHFLLGASISKEKLGGDLTVDQLEEYLDYMVDEGKLVLQNNCYSLK